MLLLLPPQVNPPPAPEQGFLLFRLSPVPDGAHPPSGRFVDDEDDGAVAVREEEVHGVRDSFVPAVPFVVDTFFFLLLLLFFPFRWDDEDEDDIVD